MKIRFQFPGELAFNEGMALKNLMGCCRTQFLCACILALVLAGRAGLGKEAQAPLPKRPNILFVIADQWRAESFGYAGNPDVQTPIIDQLARESMNFSNAVSSVPVCSPMRASLLTGQRALTHGVFLNDAPLSPGAITIAKVLRAAGYDTGCIGKWHVDGHGRSEFIPRERRQGFDYWKVLECTHDYNNSFYYADGPEKLKWEGYDAIAQTHDAREYLRDHAHADRPFFLLLSWGPPHNPYETAPQNYRDRYLAATLRTRDNVPAELRPAVQKELAGYYAHCTALDDCMGELLRTLKETGLDTNTLVVFTSDHGDLLGSHGYQRKQQPYDESIRVPMLIRLPAGFGTNHWNVEAPISSPDIMPTLLGLCGVKAPRTVEGLDFSGFLLRDESDPSHSTALISCPAPFGEWTRSKGGREYRGVRTSRYTYVRDLHGPWLMFDNVVDPWQTNNLAGKPGSAQLQAALEEVLQRKLREAKDKFLPGEEYIRQWGYKVDATGTIPYGK
jgi:arylsulfatase A-like enzyme